MDSYVRSLSKTPDSLPIASFKILFNTMHGSVGTFVVTQRYVDEYNYEAANRSGVFSIRLYTISNTKCPEGSPDSIGRYSSSYEPGGPTSGTGLPLHLTHLVCEAKRVVAARNMQSRNETAHRVRQMAYCAEEQPSSPHVR